MIKRIREAAVVALISLTLVLPMPRVTFAAFAEQNEPVVTGESAIMIDAETGIVIYEKNPDEMLYPASTTKVMTALLLLEYVKDGQELDGEPLSSEIFDERMVFSKYAVFSIEGSHIAMDYDETLSVREALYAILLPSANEVCVAIAEFVAGTESAFAEMMTERAAALGCKNTHFSNPHGLPNTEHYTTARDLAIILREAVKHEEFVKVISTRSYVIPPTEKQSEPRYINVSNKLIKPGEFYYEYAIGGKTGYTDDARHTLVQYGEKDGTLLITAVMKAEKDFTYKDTIELMNYGFAHYKYYDFAANSYSTALKIDNVDDEMYVNVLAADGLTIKLPDIVNTDKIAKTPVLDESLTLPIKKGDVVGRLYLTYMDNPIGDLALYAEEDAVVPDTASVVETARIIDSDGSDEVVPVSTTDNAPVSKPLDTGVLIAIFILVATVIALTVLIVNVFVLSKRRVRNSRYRLNRNIYK